VLGWIYLICGIVCAIAFYHIKGTLTTLFFSSLVEFRDGLGAIMISVSHLLLALGGVLLINYPTSGSRTVEITKSSKGSDEASVAKASNLRQRKKGASQDDTSSAVERVTVVKAPGFMTRFFGLTLAFLFAAFLYMLFTGVKQYSKCAVDVKDITVPQGFHVDTYANVNEARSMALSPSGVLFVSTRMTGDLYAVYDHNKDYKADFVRTFKTGLNQPNGIALKDGDLYVAEISRLLRFKNIEEMLQKAPKTGSISLDYEVLYDKWPTDTHHGWKYIAFGPDGKLYVPVGAPCNVCYRGDDSRYATIMRQTSVDRWDSWDIYASGVRNSVGFDWHPITKELWFTENGRDFLQHDIPPDELNRAPSPASYGFPWCYGQGVRDQEVQANASVETDCSKFKKPVQDLQPHAAALGIKFYRGSMFPSKYKNQPFIAEHGSWNRPSQLTGYRVSLVTLNDKGDALSYDEFAGGFTVKNIRGNLMGTEMGCGRPVDLVEMPDGSLLVSDDHAGRVYRITYKGN